MRINRYKYKQKHKHTRTHNLIFLFVKCRNAEMPKFRMPEKNVRLLFALLFELFLHFILL